MIFPYDKTRGVPRGQYYIEETTQFGDFEVEHKTQITFYSRNKEELIELCKKNNWACPDAENDASGWYTHYIKSRGWML